MTFERQPVLRGERIELRPLFLPTGTRSTRSPPIPDWEQHPVSDRGGTDFPHLLRQALKSGGALVAIARTDGAVIGSSRFFGFDPARSEVEIGWTFLARERWGGAWNGEMKRLMLGHAYRFVDSVLFLIGPDNIRSQRAVGRIGGVLEGRTERFGRDSLVFRLRAGDWAGRAAAE